MKNICIFFFLFSNIISAQFNPNLERGFIVDTLRLENDVLVPRIESLDINNKELSSKINDWILKEYGMDNWKDQHGGKWGQAYLTLIGYKIIDDILILDVYMASRGSDSDRKYFISLVSGNEIKPVDIPFSSLFKADKYLSFIEKYWYADLKQELIKSYACCEAADILDNLWLEGQSFKVKGFSFSNTKLILEEYRWGPNGTCWGSCASILIKELDLNKINSYFNDFGLKIMNDSIYKKSNHYFGYSWDENTTIEEVKYTNGLRDKVPNNLYFLGKIADKYPFKMSLNILDNGYEQKITGTYSYDSNTQTLLSLKGFQNENTLDFYEYEDGIITGHFTIKKIVKDKYPTEWVGLWTSADTKQNHEVEILAFIN